MEDMQIARSALEEGPWNLVIVKDGLVLFRSEEHGVAPFFRAVRSMGTGLHNAAAADRIVGSAVAMLCLHAGIASVYAAVASRPALDLLLQQGVSVTSGEVVPHISNHDGTDLCPFELLAGTAGSPAQLFRVLETMFGGAER